MFKRLITLALGLILLSSLAGFSQTYDFKTHQFSANDFNQWTAVGTNNIAVGAATVQIQIPVSPTAPGGRTFNPFVVNNQLLVDIGASQETVTITATTCSLGSTSCQFTATFANAHTSRYNIYSGTFGAQEAEFAAASTSGGGTVVIPPDYGGATSNITGLLVGSTSVSIEDFRSGAWGLYGWTGSAYAPVFSVGATVPVFGGTSLAATVTAMSGTAPGLASIKNNSSNFNVVSAAIGANTVAPTASFFKTRSTTGTAPATTTIVTGDDLAELSAYGADGTNYVKTASILFDSTGTIASTRVPSVIKFFTGTDAAPTVSTLALTLGADQSATFAGNVTALGNTAATGNSGAAGFATTWADTGSPAAGTTGTNTTGIANQLWYTQIYVPYNITATNVGVLCGGTCTTDKIAIGIWSASGTLLRATAATVGAGATLSGANTWQKIALSSTITLSGPARYIIGVVTSGTTAGDIQTYPLASGPVCAVAGGQGTLASFSPATTATAASCPYAFIN